VVFQKHQLIPVLLRAGAGVFWTDFDIYFYKDPIHLIPNEETDLYVTEHWNAKCLNNGLFYVRSNERTAEWFTKFMAWQYEYLFGDNQNGFDAFLKHSARDSFIPDDLPKITYKLLDVENQMISAEGWYGSRDNITLIHFWSSDYLMRDGSTERKPESLKKSHLFRIFFNGTEAEKEEVLGILRYSRPLERNPCSVTSLGINELLTEHMPHVESMLPDFKQLELQRREAMEIRNRRLQEIAHTKEKEHRGVNNLESQREQQEVETAQVEGAHCAAQVEEQPVFVEILKMIGQLEDIALLTVEHATSLKKLCRQYDRGLLMTFKAFHARPWPRLAVEMEILLET